MKRPMIEMITKDTTLCLSLSARPSNNGTRLHNYLYAQLGLDFIYKGFRPADITQAIAGVRGLGVRGVAVSMPYKEDVIALVDEMDASASSIQSVNTIVNTDGHLKAYNTDYIAVRDLLLAADLDRIARVIIQGAGGMAKATVAALHDTGFQNLTVLARNAERGQALAEQYGAVHRGSIEDCEPAAVIINVTPMGMEGDAEDVLSFPQEFIEAASVVMDVVAVPAETPLITAARAAGKRVITGAEVMVLQAVEQFELYTGIRPEAELVAEAAEYMRTGQLPE